MGQKFLKIIAFLAGVAVVAALGYVVFGRQRNPVQSDRMTVVSRAETTGEAGLPSPVAGQTADTVTVKPPVLAADSHSAGISAKAQVVYDVASKKVVYSVNPDERLMPASTTKMMTALVAMSEYAPDEIITIGRASDAIGASVDLLPGEQLTVFGVVKAMLMNSGNDAAFALADHHPEGYRTFVDLMNRKATSFGLKNTHFADVSGVETDGHYSSAADLAVIADKLMENPDLRQIVGTKAGKVTSTDGRHIHKLENLNQLLWEVPGVMGVKTGWTENAGDCLVAYTSRKKHDIITVVLKSKDRFADSTAIIEWAYQNLNWE